MTSFLLVDLVLSTRSKCSVPSTAPTPPSSCLPKLNVSIGREQNTHVHHNKIMSLMLNAVRRSAPLGPTADIAIDPN